MFKFVIFDSFIICVVFGFTNTIEYLLLTRLMYMIYHPYREGFTSRGKGAQMPMKFGHMSNLALNVFLGQSMSLTFML